MAAGQVKIYRLTESGEEKVVEVMGQGRTFAEPAIFMQQRRYPASAEALTKATIYVIPGDYYLNLLRNNPDICLRLLGSLSRSLQKRLNEVETLSSHQSPQRLATYLLQCLPEEAIDGCQITLPAAKQVIAAQLGIKPETLSRLLHNFKKEGVIDVHGANIEVHDIAALKAIR